MSRYGEVLKKIETLELELTQLKSELVKGTGEKTTFKSPGYLGVSVSIDRSGVVHFAGQAPGFALQAREVAKLITFLREVAG